MKLIIMIPAYNEEHTLPITLKDLPSSIPGVDEIETLVVNDGSRDETARIARECGVNHVLNFKSNRGLARVFQEGLKTAYTLNADIIVNFDADNQYSADSIVDLIQPIIEKQADVVVGCRPIESIKHFSRIKKKLQRIGSRVVQKVSGTDVADMTSGFRAFNREAALKLVVVSEFTYTLETIIQAKTKGLTVKGVPIKVNPGMLRESRLFKGSFQYIVRSFDTILRIYFMYNLFRFLRRTGICFIVIGFGISFRFLYYFITAAPGEAVGHVQSLILAAILFIMGAFMITTSFMADLVHHNRKLSEEILYHQRKASLDIK